MGRVLDRVRQRTSRNNYPTRPEGFIYAELERFWLEKNKTRDGSLRSVGCGVEDHIDICDQG